MKRVAEAFGVARSNLIEQTQKPENHRRRHRPRDDGWLLERIRGIIDNRTTYGYRRTTACLNRQLNAENRPLVNHKRVYRVMRENKLLLQCYTAKPQRIHDGKVVTLHSNLRWCSDAFEFRCWNGERVQVAFSLDCCDREVLGFVSTTPTGITGEMIRDLMWASISHRFGGLARCVPHPIEWLSDNGSCYTALETRRFADKVGLVPCTTPAYSPESNGMAEAFVKTFKRDYIYVNSLESAEAVMRQLPAWFEDYNENHPHKGLKMKSPREYMRLNSAA
jgi:putative transposase